MLRIGLPDRYVTHGKPALLREEVGLTGEAVAERILAALRSGSAGPQIDLKALEPKRSIDVAFRRLFSDEQDARLSESGIAGVTTGRRDMYL